MVERTLTAAQLADALGCFWNAAIGAAHERGSYDAMSTASVMASGFAAVQARLLEIAALTTEPASPQEPDFASTIAALIKDECESGAAAGWRSCTGCHESNEGYETGRYPYSPMFGCHVGHGCSECGGLGVVWEYWSESDLEAMARDDEPAAPEGRQEAAAETKVAFNGFITCVSGDGDPYVKVQFRDLREAQSFHRALLSAIPAMMSPTRPAEQAVTDEMVEKLVASYHSATEKMLSSEDIEHGHRVGVRDVAVRLGVYDRFVSALAQKEEGR